MSCKRLVIFLVPIALGQYINELEYWNGHGSRTGRYVNIGHYPYVVSIRYAKSRKIICTGIILTLSWVLSVPYCFLLTPDHYKRGWDSEGTIPPLIETLAKKRKKPDLKMFSLETHDTIQDTDLRPLRFGPFKFNSSLFTSTTENPWSEEHFEKSTSYLNPSDFEIIAGTSTVSDCGSDGQFRIGEKILIHPRFKQSLRKQRNPKHELALLKMNLPFVEKGSVTNAPLTDSFLLGQHSSKSCQLIGWGRGKTKRPRAHLKTALSEITVQLYNSLTCRYIENSYRRAVWDDDEDPWFCSYDEKNHAIPVCQSDSGAPLVCSGKVVALLSWIRSPTCYYNGTEYFQYLPIYYSRIYLDLKWLRETLGESGARLSIQREGDIKGSSNSLGPFHFVIMGLLAILICTY